jgi:hypothetical protein
VREQATTESRRELDAWRDRSSPAWIPDSRAELSTDLAAALSQLPSPDSWKDVHLTPAGGGEPWTMHVEIKGGYPIDVEVPGGSDARDLLRLLSDPEQFDMEDSEDWDDWRDDYDFDVGYEEGTT